MPIQELAPVTLAEVTGSIAEFESQYDLNSADFLNTGTNIPDDDAAEWNYLLQQREALLANARIATFGSITASAHPQAIRYGYSRLSKRTEASAEDQRQQYDCAA